MILTFQYTVQSRCNELRRETMKSSLFRELKSVIPFVFNSTVFDGIMMRERELQQTRHLKQDSIIRWSTVQFSDKYLIDSILV